MQLLKSRFTLILLIFLQVPAMANTARHALVIGNAAYQHVEPLVNTLNDARDISADLKKSGFTVTLVENTSLDQLIEAMDRYVDRLQSAGGVGLLYYSGHGVQVDGHNYLVPIDAHIKKQSRIKYEAYSLDDALRAMAGRGSGAVNLVVLDACRDNPFAATRSVGSKGLARVSAPESTLILYATRPGDTASDNPGQRNGLFTKHLRTAIQQPGINVEQAFSNVVRNVYSESNRTQYPWKEGVLLKPFAFMPGKPSQSPNYNSNYNPNYNQGVHAESQAESQAVVSRPAATQQPVQPSQSDDELLFWQSSQQCGTQRCLQAYVETYPKGRFTKLAKAMLKPAAPARVNAPELFAVNINVEPADALIQFSGSNDRYQNGMKLKPGKYKLKISRAGYLDLNTSIILKADNTDFRFELKKKPTATTNLRTDSDAEIRTRENEEYKDSFGSPFLQTL